MQAGSSPYLPPPPQHYYQNIYHIPVVPQDHELKRQYLTLLPPQRIIEICLTFDVHVPPYIKSTIWPPDISAAIENLRKPTASNDVSPSAAPQKDNDKAPEPIMASLDKPPEESSNPEQTSSTTETQTSEPQPPDKTTENPSQATTTPATAQTPASPIPASQPTVSTVPPVHQQSQYPQQPYIYPPAAYPHAPYYSQPPGYPAYPSYPPYSSPVPNGYPPPPHPGFLPNPIYPTPQPSANQEQGSDDLPSYEEMIVEALRESTDPEGCAPKDLFAWMATRYPVQSNFRPSASQALQKAYKRGRFEKSSNGKYRLSASWEGGNTSKRTTRRPQTQTQTQSSAMVNTSGSPFTHTPLVHHHQQIHQSSLQYPGQPYLYPYGGAIPPVFPGFPQTTQPPPQAGSPQTTKATTNGTDKSGSTLDPGSNVDKDTYDAAQNILKAINFGDLFQVAPDGSADGRKPDDISVDQFTSLLVQAQNVIAQSGEAGAVPQVVSPPAAQLPTLSSSAGIAVAMGSISGSPTNIRAELQAQFALLAAQLIELSQEHVEDNMCAVGQHQIELASSSAIEPLSSSLSQTMQEQRRWPPSTASLAAFEPPIMDALIPPPGLSLPQSQSRLQPDQSSVSQSHTQPNHRPHQESSSPRPSPQQDDIHIDPTLRGLGGIVGVPSSVPPPTASEQIPPISPASTIHPVPSASPTTSVASATAPPPPPPPVYPATDSVQTPRPEPEPEPDKHAAPNSVHEEADTDDEDMEEIA